MRGCPQICVTSVVMPLTEMSCTSDQPAAMSSTASARCTERMVSSVSPYSAETLTKPVAPSGKPMLPASR